MKYAAFALLLVLASCEQRRAAPASANLPIEPTADGFLALFESECVEQINRQWAIDESDRRRRDCHFFMNGAGEAGDCESEMVGHVAWTVPTTRNSSAQVSLEWIADRFDPPRGAHLNCSIEVFEPDGIALQEAMRKFADNDSRFRMPPERGTDEYNLGAVEYWRWSPNIISEATPKLELLHGPFVEDDPNFGRERTLNHHDWQLSLRSIYGPRH